MNGREDSGSSQNDGTCRNGRLDQTDNSALWGMGLNLGLNSRELGPSTDYEGDDYV